MTTTEMDGRKLNIIRFLLKEDLSEERLQLFESTREIIEYYRQERLGDEGAPSGLREPEIEYNVNPQPTDARKTAFMRYLLNEVEDEESLVEFEALCNDRMPPCMYTEEELNARADRAEAEFAQGGGIPHEEIKKMIEAWK
ncbi:hypothetical protein LJC38_02955 [Parabacteroides sp. OttesenSCG-928-K15]|nr:hypothetical protein [Parabacteroides sp. OttesenSCG-928-K15]